MCARTRAYHQATATAWRADDAPFNQRPPNHVTPALLNCDASKQSEPTTYQEAMRLPYHAKWSHAMEREVAGLEEAGAFGDT